MVKTHKLLSKLLLIFVILTLSIATAGKAYALWFNPNWGFRQMITIDSTQVPGDLTNFPVLVSITDPNLRAMPAGNVGRADGGDIAFTLSDGFTQLNHEIESYNPATGELIAWVQVPNVSSGADTEIYIYYGNPGAADQWNANETWDSNYRGVWHLSEDPSGSAPQMQDSTVNNNDGTTAGGMTLGDQVAGQIDGSLDFDGSNDYVIRNPVSNFPTTAITASFWMNSSNTTKNGTPISYASSGGNNDFLIYNYNNFSIWRGSLVETSVSANDGSWHHIAVTWRSSDGQVRLYKDGSQTFSGTLSTGTSITGGGSLVFAQEQDNVGNLFDPTQAFLGIIDEVRISNILRSTNWVETSYNNQVNPGSFLSFSAQEEFISVPALNQWGMIVFIMLAGFGAVYYLRKRSAV